MNICRVMGRLLEEVGFDDVPVVVGVG